MSENAKNNSCLHCSVFSTKYQYQEIFDEFGIELGLQSLLAKHFLFEVSPDPRKQQLLCEVCVNNLIRLFDIDELERERDAAKDVAQCKDPKAVDPIIITEVHATPPAAKPVKKAAPSRPLTKVLRPVPIIPIREPSARIRNKAAAASHVTPDASRSPEPAPHSSSPEASVLKNDNNLIVKVADQEQFSVLIQNILDEEEAIVEDDNAVKEESSEAAPEETETPGQIVILNSEAGAETNLDENVYIYEHDDVMDPNLDNVKVKPISGSSRLVAQAEESQSDDDIDEGETSNIVLFNFVDIKEKDDVDNIPEYLSTVVRTSFEKLTFEWCTVCKHCSLKCPTFESLLGHLLKAHKTRKDVHQCPIEGCNKELKGRKFLAMHLVMLHAPVAEIAIYGCCPECKLTFSNILQYNKHSCAHVIKKKRGIRSFCEMCSLEFPSWKRFNFHNQFHLEKHRPRACFVCDYASTNIDELFQHLNYAHEPVGTLFCDLCDRTFRDPSVFMEHNKSHANVSSTTYSCGECMANFESRGRLNGHMRAMHGSVISCELCSREFATEATYNIHMKKHLIIEKDVHVCSTCGLLSDSRETLLAHVDSVKTACFGSKIYVELLRDAYVCEYCSSYFKEKDSLQAHRDSGVHKDGVFWCQPCGKEFAHMKLYRHHLRNYQQLRADSTHRRLEICVYYMCDQENCSESYVNWNSLYTHKRRTHESSNKQAEKSSRSAQEWVCQFCLKECRSKMSLSVHVARSHNNDNVTCPLCNASYKSRDALAKHHAYWHEPIECPECFKIVKNRRNYDTHVNVVHSNKKRYSCSVCEKGFYHKSEMEAHQKLHGQSYNCDQCSFTTRNKKSLSVHVLGQHYKRFAFECNVCKKRFGRSQGLKTHMQRAHGDKYTCRDYFDGGCGRTFVNSSQLNVHVRKVHDGIILLQEDVVEEDECIADDVPSTSKKRCLRLNENNIEFIEEADGDDIELEEDDDEDDDFIDEIQDQDPQN
ncbi:zinc finger protein 27 [Drosophila teissieri]|uniref:zinc finger protein 27 n=1 Tax=Drosophila teissieri TaxID=7243 RepID=UPI001CBA2125|nr:zinc finger protein 27 [Drosophila teissieri]XP_043641342.1 zinc finger protein 27 [Drosophila teissieri]XP_043641343.1 zinc finger protein 27 [Drosophila teissieri]